MSLRGGYFIVDMSPLPPIKGGISNGIKSAEAMQLIDNMIKSSARVFLMSGLRFDDKYGTLVQQDAWCPAVESNLSGIEELTNADFKIPIKNVWAPSKSGASTVTTYVICFSKADGIYYQEVTNTYKDYSDYQKEFLRTDGQNSMSANLNLNSHKLVNLAAPTAGTDGAHKKYVDDKISQQLSNYPQWFCTYVDGQLGSERPQVFLNPLGGIMREPIKVFPSLASTFYINITEVHWNIIKKYNNFSSDEDIFLMYYIIYKMSASDIQANNVGETCYRLLLSPILDNIKGNPGKYEGSQFHFDVNGSENGGMPYNAQEYYVGFRFGG